MIAAGRPKSTVPERWRLGVAPGVGVHPDLPDTFVHFTGRPRGVADSPPSFADEVLEGQLGNVARVMVQILAEPPTRDQETAGLRWVRQPRRYPLWRVFHAYHPEMAVRLICWFPPKFNTVVVALFAADKARLGDVFYDGVAARADPLIDQRKRETASKEEP
jgi:hypothetical protein